MNFKIPSLLVLALVVSTHAQSEPALHAGSCPRVGPNQVGLCYTYCIIDGDCQQNEKCCSNGCGFICTPVVTAPEPAVHAGSCPRVTPGQGGSCVQGCESDANCAPTFKCCGTGCGFACKQAVRGSSGRN